MNHFSVNCVGFFGFLDLLGGAERPSRYRFETNFESTNASHSFLVRPSPAAKNPLQRKACTPLPD